MKGDVFEPNERVRFIAAHPYGVSKAYEGKIGVIVKRFTADPNVYTVRFGGRDLSLHVDRLERVA